MGQNIAAQVAARLAEWGGVWRGTTSYGGVAGGSQFLPDLFGGNGRQSVEMAFGADLTQHPDFWPWVDVTSDVLWASGVNCTIGRSPEAITATPAAFNCVLKNNQPNGGDYTIGNALGARWPNIKENTPIRARLDIGTGAVTRFYGFATNWKPAWDVDRSYAIVNFSANGILRRLKQGRSFPKSALRRVFEEATTPPVAYWPLEDISGSISAASAVVNGAPMLAAGGGTASAAIEFGVAQGRTQGIFTGFEVTKVATNSFVSLKSGGSLTAALPVGTGTTWTIQFTAFSWAYTGFAGTNIVLARWFTPGGSFIRWDVVQSSLTGGIELIAYNSAGAATTLCTSNFAPVDEYQHMVIVAQNGANVDTTLWTARVITAGLIGSIDTDSRAGTLAFPINITINPDRATATGSPIVGSENQSTDIRFGHLGVWYGEAPYAFAVATSVDTEMIYSPWAGYVGESVTERLTRLCRKANIFLDCIGPAKIPMGPQPSATLVDLLADCERSDRGVMYDGLNAGVTYYTRMAAYSNVASLVIDAGDGMVLSPLLTEADDLGRINQFIASSPTGGEQTYEQISGDLGTDTVGVYDSSGTFSMIEDEVLRETAAWVVYQGTVRGIRYPALSMQIAKPATSVIAQQWLDTRLFYRVDVLSLEPNGVEPDKSFLLRGWTERWDSLRWKVDLQISPYGVWNVVTLADELADNSEFVLHLDTDNSTLAADVLTGATSFDVNTISGPIWITTADDVDGLYVIISGLKVRVTAITGASSPQTFTIDPATVLKSLPAGSPVSVWQPPVLGL